MTNDAADAEDVTQDSFIAALERLEDCKEPDRFSGWLMQIVRNRALNFRRAQTIRAAAPLDAVENAASSSNPERDTSRSLLREELSDALEQLTELQRQVVMLHDIEGYKHREIGELLRELAALLRGRSSLQPRGVAMILRLLSDGTGPMYAESPAALERELRRARAALAR